ncbi:ATPase [Thermosipho affectus]|uniref:ATPase n=1 Tax=Thermosipho affectus TaxID=660294 RepID=A0ABX3IGV5_9BACT|nr:MULTISPECIES: SRPBCC domain-containing protein [Thermosipho]ANQ53712.1 ATPase [Thermosipho sp. 1070]APT72158.1 ATPase [Thermosipho sp. 1063]ONN27061.1 ATPase [Thermosipho affectus]
MLKLKPMHFTDFIDAPVEKVYKTFVNENGWDPWFTDGMKMELKDGGKIFFRWERLTGEEVIDRGYTIEIIPNKLWEFWWYEYEDGFRSKVTIKFQKNLDGGTWISITDNTIVKSMEEIDIRYGCAFGWGQMLILAKAYIEQNIILLR